MKNKILFILEILAIGIVVFICSKFFFQICFVKGDSMLPTYKDGQILLAKKYNIEIKANDVIVINKNNKIIIKRAIGLPNDIVQIKNGNIYINNKKFDDIYIEKPGSAVEEIRLKNDEYFVLGDNRQHSIDSRFDEIGIINTKEILGIIL